MPDVFDAVQYLYDLDRTRWRFVLCGSSARRLRATGVNLLSGRSFLHRLYPLTLVEQPYVPPAANTVRDWGAFVRFLQFAALESGGVLNYAGISQEVGVSQPTIKSYYQLLEDMFIGFRVPAWTRSARKNVLSTPKFLFFDLGVRNAAAGLRISTDLVPANPGSLFEQWVGIELWKRLGYLGGTLYYQRTHDGAEVDFVVELDGRLVPVEVTYTERPTMSDARHLMTFLAENPSAATHGYIICRCARPLRLHDRITALPWHLL